MRNHPAVAFRIAKQEDIPLIQDLASRIWKEHYPGIITQEQIDYMLGKMYSPEVIRDEIEQQEYRYILVVSENKAVGFMAYVHEQAREAVRISKLYLLPALHGQGIGRQMLAYVKEDAHRSGAKLLYLFVNKQNDKAIRAYERFGMNKTAEIVTDIGAGFVMDDFRMELRL